MFARRRIDVMTCAAVLARADTAPESRVSRSSSILMRLRKSEGSWMATARRLSLPTQRRAYRSASARSSVGLLLAVRQPYFNAFAAPFRV